VKKKQITAEAQRYRGEKKKRQPSSSFYDENCSELRVNLSQDPPGK